MNTSLYSRLARRNVRSNYRFFLPRILAEAGLVAVLYIVLTLARDERLSQVRGGDYIAVFMMMGAAIIAMLTVIIMLYVNSFLMKQRRREFGLYNVLGLEKHHVGLILFFETLFVSLVSIALGLVIGMLFYKLATLAICRLLETEVIRGFYYVTSAGLWSAAVLFIIIDLLTFLFNRISLARMRVTEQLQSRSAGEREPKIKWLLFLLGLATLGFGYYIAVATESPLRAMANFFIAVLLVIIGTYCLFVSGSIFVLKCLKNNKRFYYTARHMPVISGLLYRMKQNAVGLASICILSTGVLVMMSTTVSLYAGVEKSLQKNYPRQYYLKASYTTAENVRETVPPEEIMAAVQSAAEEQSLEIESAERQRYLTVTYNFTGNGVFSTDRDAANLLGETLSLATFTVITEEVWHELGGELLSLQPGEVGLCTMGVTLNESGIDSTLQLGQNSFTVAATPATFPIGCESPTTRYYGMVVTEEDWQRIYNDQKIAYGEAASEGRDLMAFAFADPTSLYTSGYALQNRVEELLQNYADAHGGSGTLSLAQDSVWDARESLFGMYGALLFLGMLLGLVCLFATTLIIYYKQISEGYEDRDRFQIMQKLGMSAAEVKKTVNAQMLLVFFLPLLFAGIHICFAFPLLEKMLRILMLPDPRIFALGTLVTYGLFALVYVLIYTGTSKTYYKIVH